MSVASDSVLMEVTKRVVTALHIGPHVFRCIEHANSIRSYAWHPLDSGAVDVGGEDDEIRLIGDFEVIVPQQKGKPPLIIEALPEVKELDS